MLSVMDAIMAAPLVEVLANIHIARDVLDALLGIAGGDNRMALVYGAVRKYEIADWDSAFAYAHQLGVRPDAIPPMYVEALRWAERVFSAES
jgi:c-di-GMP-related signal transduction protein